MNSSWLVDIALKKTEPNTCELRVLLHYFNGKILTLLNGNNLKPTFTNNVHNRLINMNYSASVMNV